MPVSHELQCIFVHIPKTAGTSVEKALGVFGDWRHEDRNTMFGLSTELMINGKAPSSAFLQHLTAAELRAILPAETWSYFRFSIVRNPWDKIVSAYSKKDVHLCRSAMQQGLNLEAGGFEEFVQRTAEINHAHLRPQTEYLFADDGELLVDFVGRWETLIPDFARICDQLGVDLVLPWENASQRNDYRDYYSAATRRLVEQRYRSDIEAFGYAF